MVQSTATYLRRRLDELEAEFGARSLRAHPRALARGPAATRAAAREHRALTERLAGLPLPPRTPDAPAPTTSAAPDEAEVRRAAAVSELEAALRKQALAEQGLTHVQRAGLALAEIEGEHRPEEIARVLELARALDEQAAARQRDAEAEAAGQRQAEARAALREAELSLLGAADQDRARVRAWAAEQIAAAGASDELAAAIGRVRDEMLRRIDDEEAAAAPTAEAGARRALQAYASAALDAGAQVEGALVDFVRSGRLNFTRLVDSLIADLARLAIRQAILGPLAQALGGVFGGGGGGGVPPIAGYGGGHYRGGGVVAHAGGVVGRIARQRQLPAWLWDGAPRLHAGGRVGPGEVPAILQRGETVLPRGVQPGPREVRVEVRNESSQPVRARQADARVDAGRLVIGVVLEDVGRGGPLAGALEGTYGLRRRVS